MTRPRRFDILWAEGGGFLAGIEKNLWRAARGGGAMRREDAAPFFPMLRGMGGALVARLAGEFEEAAVRDMLTRADEAFQANVPSIPEVGADNPWLKSLVGVAWLAGVWLELEKRGWSIPRISLTTQRALADFAQASLPAEKRSAVGAAMCSPELAQKIAARSRERRFPDDWLVEAVLPREGDPFDVGYDVFRCPVVQYLEERGLRRFAAWFCRDDYPLHAAMGIRLERTRTLADGADRCDFRLKRCEGPFTQIVE